MGHLNSIASDSPYAGFWLRFAAGIIDWLVCLVGGALLGAILSVVLLSDLTGNPDKVEAILNGFGIIIIWIYYSVMESSPTQATLGKMACGIEVVDLNGRRIEFSRATGRYFGKFISVFTIFIGFFAIAFTQNKQGLHDILAGCLVVKKNYDFGGLIIDDKVVESDSGVLKNEAQINPLKPREYSKAEDLDNKIEEIKSIMEYLKY